jgi:hypothetical protein
MIAQVMPGEISKPPVRASRDFAGNDPRIGSGRVGPDAM